MRTDLPPSVGRGAGILRVDHIGIFVDEMPVAADEISALLGLMDDVPRVHTDRVDAAFLACDDTRLELVAPRDPDVAGLAPGQPARIDHVAFEVEDADQAHAALTAAGIALQGPPLPVPGGLRSFFTAPGAVRGLTLQFLDRGGENG